LYVDAPKPKKVEETKPQKANDSVPAKIKKLYLRVPARESEQFLKAVNLIDIFEGGTQVIFYPLDEKSYFSYSRSINISDFVLSELSELLGEGNVVYR
jgi:hypothetical protein